MPGPCQDGRGCSHLRPSSLEDEVMMPCCFLTYEKYIELDGTVNYDDYEALRQKRLAQPKKRKDRRKPEEQARLEARLPKLEPGDPVCQCPCHMQGRSILH